MKFHRWPAWVFSGLATLTACAGNGPADGAPPGDASGSAATERRSDPRFPLTLVGDVELPGRANRFDYQDIDRARGHLFLTHMNDASVVIANLNDGAVVKVLPDISTPRGVVVAEEVGRTFVTSSPNQLVIIDNAALTEIARVGTGAGPDGVGWDPVHRIVAVSDQRDGAVSLIRDAGSGARVQVRLGAETGNVIFDPTRASFWVAVVAAGGAGQLVAVDPALARVTTTIDLPGCGGAHGLRLHPDGQSAFVACEDNDKLARVDLAGAAHAVSSASTGAGPDVLGIDPGLGLLYVAAESGMLTVFDIREPRLVAVDTENVGSNAHSVAVDPTSHRVFFPLQAGPSGKPVLRIMRPRGI
jgi:hypothetical protein